MGTQLIAVWMFAGVLGIVKFLVGDLLKLDVNSLLCSPISEVPGTVDDLAAVIFKVGITLQKLLDGILPGLGTAVNKSEYNTCACAHKHKYTHTCTHTQTPTHRQHIQIGTRKETSVDYISSWPYCSAVLNAPKICKKGLFPEGGLGGDADCACAKKVMDEGCSEGKAHMAKINGGKGLIKVVVQILQNLLKIGNRCKASDYKIGMEDFSSMLNELISVEIALGKRYKGGNLISENHIQNNIEGCEKGEGLTDGLKGVCNK
ncbi:hypothetical protein EVAR_13790_1 [Eumeta japonica]|uniref:Uncharacterized protein n=1 Tax=Eumeta variegata TaxID=151549 RepID=A0A4C1U1U6_EUMVA|nr:hypothetical protein EVAR_13790_1 [Eumeta japonica]